MAMYPPYQWNKKLHIISYLPGVQNDKNVIKQGVEGELRSITNIYDLW